MNATKLFDDDFSLIFDAPLDPAALYARALALTSAHNLGACVSFAGIIRAEANERGQAVAGLSFDLAPALLAGWLGGWKARESEQLRLFFAHARGDVLAGECSYFAAICARKRAEANALLPEFVEDFKRHAPIWKYDLVAATATDSAADAAAVGGVVGGVVGGIGAVGGVVGAVDGVGGVVGADGVDGDVGDVGEASGVGGVNVGKAATGLRRVYAAERSFSLPHAGLLAK